MIIEPVRNYVIFTFVEDITGDRFINSARGVIQVTSDDKAQTKHPRWGKVTNVGPDVKDIEIGEYVLIEAGKWTSYFVVDGVRYWKTDDEQVVLVSDEPGTTY